jgi:hypothetical protein
MSTFATAHGIHVPRAADLKEGYQVIAADTGSFRIRANISVEKLDAFFRSCLGYLREPLFFIVEAPVNEVRELELRKQPSDRFHRDVFYLDGLTAKRAFEVYDRFNQVLIHDGFVHFGVGAHDNGHEVFVGSYKIVQLFGKLPNPFEGALAEFMIPRVERLVTAWDTFTESTPGQKSRYSIEGADIYTMIEELMRNDGLYHAKTIED